MSVWTWLEAYATTFVTVMDSWVVIAALLTLGYMVTKFKSMQKRETAITYIVFLGLFAFWGLRSLFVTYTGPDMSMLFYAFSFLLDFAVIGFFVYLFYFYWKRNLSYVEEKLSLIESASQTIDDVDAEHEETTMEEDASDGVDKGFTYLILERGAEYGFRLFTQTSHRVPGICFSRTHPRKLRSRHDLDDLPVFWLTQKDGEEADDVIEPFRLNFVKEVILEFVRRNEDEDKGAVVLIDGMEYLLFKNPFEKVMNFVQDMVDQLSDHEDVSMIVSMEGDSLSKRKLALLRSEFDEVRIEEEDGGVKKLHF